MRPRRLPWTLSSSFEDAHTAESLGALILAMQDTFDDFESEPAMDARGWLTAPAGALRRGRPAVAVTT
jgi:hypothetical protein